MFAIRLVIGMFLALAAMWPGQALAQLYQPGEFERPEHAVQLEIEQGFDVFAKRRVKTKKEQEHQSKSWTMFGRLGPVSIEKDDGVTLKRGSGPKIGSLSIGIRKRF